MHTLSRFVRDWGPGLLLVVMAAPFASGQTVEERLQALEEKVENWDEGTLRVYWKDSLRLETADGLARFRIGGRLHNDWAWSREDSDLEDAGLKVEDGVVFRRARLYLSGEINKNLEFKFQYDFAGGDADFKDVYMGVKNLPSPEGMDIGGLRIGQYKEPYGLETLTSSNDITFAERALPNVFAPDRNVGFMVHNTVVNDRFYYAAHFGRPTDDNGNGIGDGDYAFTGRVTGLPYYEEDGRQLIHVGAGATYRTPDEIRYRARAEYPQGPRPVDVDLDDIDSVTGVSLEAAGVFGPFSVQGEYLMADVDSDTNEGTVGGGYVYASYFLTGENRRYKTSGAVFTFPKVNDPVFRKDGGFGPGAWEVAARWSALDLNDDDLQGGRLTGVTAGVNWYLSNNARVMFNYIHSMVGESAASTGGVDGDLDIFTMRFQFHF